ncbi:MAG: glycosyltransferase family 1 protein, partial [Planctomycetes bacterium]|nr:glycosyltransferase family 1 protein [Planctomycetota bacterium]
RVWIGMGGLEWCRPRHGFLARTWLKVMEGMACRAAHRLIFDNQSMAEELELRRESRSAVSVIPYGANLSVKTPGLDALHQLGLEPQRYALMVCDLEPSNHVLEVVGAVSAHPSGLPLIVVSENSASNRYQRHVLDLAGDQVRFVGPIQDADTLRALRYHSHVTIHGNGLDGTHPFLLEAMGCGNFVLAHDNPFNREVLGPMGRYFTDGEDFVRELQCAEETPERQRRLVGDGARDRVMNLYSWDAVGAEYLALLRYDLKRQPVASEYQDQRAAG